MTTICCISDSHLGYRHKLKLQRLKDYEKAFNEALDRAMSLETSLLIFGGDIFHHTRPDPKSMRVLLERIIEVADRVPCVFCIGNHEIETSLSSTYTPILSIIHENVHVLTSENPHIRLELRDKSVGLHGFQFIRDRKSAEGTLDKITSEVSGNDFNILCIHQAIEGYLEPHEVSIRALRDIAEKYDLILSGHVHKHQKIGEVFDIVPAYYIGSTERISFNEAENDTGILVFNNFDFRHPIHVPVNSASMRSIQRDFGRKKPEELNKAIKQLIEENLNIRCLQLNISAEIDGDYLDVRHDWETPYPDFTILDVILNPKLTNRDIDLKNRELNEGIFDEYFEKMGLSGREDLKDLCKELYRKYGS